jgi:hypothetical protein
MTILRLRLGLRLRRWLRRSLLTPLPSTTLIVLPRLWLRLGRRLRLRLRLPPALPAATPIIRLWLRLWLSLRRALRHWLPPALPPAATVVLLRLRLRLRLCRSAGLLLAIPLLPSAKPAWNLPFRRRWRWIRRARRWRLRRRLLPLPTLAVRLISLVVLTATPILLL